MRDDKATPHTPGDGENLLRHAIASIPAVVWSTDCQLRFTSARGLGLSGLNLRPDGVVGVALSDYFQTDDPDFIALAAHRRAVEGESVCYEQEWMGRVYQTSLSPLRDGQGEIFGCVGVAHDVTEQKRAEQALKDSEARYHAFFEQAPDSIVLIDPETHTLAEFNDRAHQSLGYTREEFETLTLPDFEVVESAREVARHAGKIVEEGADTFETKHRSKEGEIRHVQVSAKTISVRGKNFVQGIWRDVTEQKRAEELLRVQHDLGVRLNTVFDLNTALELCLDAAVEAASMDCGGIYLRNDDGSLDLAVSRGISAGFASIAAHYDADSAHARLVAEAAPFYVEHGNQLLPFRDDTINREGLRAIAVLSICHEGKLVACLNVASRTVDEIPVVARSTLEAIAAQIGAAIVRIRAEQALRVSEQRYRAVFEQAADAIVLIDPHTGALAEFNDSAPKNLGYSREEFQNLKIPDFEVLESADHVAKHLAKILKKGTDYFETKHRTKGGEIRNVLVSSRAISIRGGDFIQSIWRDITERKRGEELLRAQRDLAMKVSAASDLKDALQVCLDVAVEAASMDCGAVYLRNDDGSLDLAADSGLSADFASRVSRCDADSPHARLVAGATPIYAEYANLPLALGDDGNNPEGMRAMTVLPVCHEGKTVACLNVASRTAAEIPVVLRSALETIASQIGNAIVRIKAQEALKQSRDQLEERVRERTAELAIANLELRKEIAEREQAEEALRESEERFRLAFENGPVGMTIVSAEQTILRANRVLCQMLGYGEEELQGKHIHVLTHPDDLDSLLTREGHFMRSGAPGFALEKRYLAKDGRIVWGRLSVSAVRDRNGNFMYALGMVEDLTARKQAEEALRRAKRLASVGTLAAGIAHEINNPLHGIVLYAESAMRCNDRPEMDQARQEYLRKIQDEALRCGQIVKSVLQFARHERSQKWPSCPGAVARRACDLTHRLAAEKRVSVDIELDGDGARVLLNPTEMQQVFVNLITNAIQASQPGDRVTVRLEPEDGAVRVVVEDHGCGMTEEQVDRVLDPFYTTRLQEGGTGLGMSLSYGIVREHGGTIDVQSTPHKGTAVAVVLPLKPPPTQEAEDGEDSDR